MYTREKNIKMSFLKVIPFPGNMFDVSEMKKINSRQKVSYFNYAVWHVKMMDYLWFSLFSRIVKPWPIFNMTEDWFPRF